MAEEKSADQDSKPGSGPETARTIMKIGLLVGVVLILTGGFLLFLNLTGNVTPFFVTPHRGYTGVEQGGVLASVGLVVIIIMVIGLIGGPEDESTG